MRIRTSRPVPLLQHPGAFLRGQHIDVGDRLRLFGTCHRFQERLPVADIPLDRRLLVQRRRIVQATDHAAVDLLQRQAQILLRGGLLLRHVAQRQAGQFELGVRRVLPHQHRLEQRRVRQAALRLHRLDHLLERQLLMFLARQHLRLHAAQQLAHAGRSAQVHAQRQRVHEEADQAFHFASVAAGDRAADHHVVLARQSAQHRRPRGQQRHVRRHAVTAAQAVHGLGELTSEMHGQRAPAVALLRGAGMVGRQLQPRRGAGERGAPELGQRLQTTVLQSAALPLRVVRVLDLQRRQRRRLALQRRRIALAELVRPARPSTSRPRRCGASS